MSVMSGILVFKAKRHATPFQQKLREQLRDLSFAEQVAPKPQRLACVCPKPASEDIRRADVQAYSLSTQSVVQHMFHGCVG